MLRIIFSLFLPGSDRFETFWDFFLNSVRQNIAPENGIHPVVFQNQVQKRQLVLAENGPCSFHKMYLNAIQRGLKSFFELFGRIGSYKIEIQIFFRNFDYQNMGPENGILPVLCQGKKFRTGRSICQERRQQNLFKTILIVF